MTSQSAPRESGTCWPARAVRQSRLNCSAISAIESRARSTFSRRARSSSWSSGPSHAPRQRTGTPARCGSTASQASGVVIIARGQSDTEPRRWRNAVIARQGVQSALQKPTHRHSGSGLRRRPRGEMGSSTTWRRACSVPDCAHSQRSASGCCGPSARTASGTGNRRCRSRGRRDWRERARPRVVLGLAGPGVLECRVSSASRLRVSWRPNQAAGAWLAGPA